VIAGKPNAGKSSLMNALSGDDTAIVTDIAGTTRDVLRETIRIDGLTVDLVDTAGLRDDPDRIEEEGIRRARRAMETADAILWVVDSTDEDLEAPQSERPTLVVKNKIDLLDSRPSGIAISAVSGDGLDDLKSAIKQLAGYRPEAQGAFSARKRHVEALERARAHFDAGNRALIDQAAGELLAEELKLAQEALSEMTGALSSDELLGRIFADFCIGK
jgi:tRNA modification GTPase